jgi:hypothetical protein
MRPPGLPRLLRAESCSGKHLSLSAEVEMPHQRQPWPPRLAICCCLPDGAPRRTTYMVGKLTSPSILSVHSLLVDSSLSETERLIDRDNPMTVWVSSGWRARTALHLNSGLAERWYRELGSVAWMVSVAGSGTSSRARVKSLRNGPIVPKSSATVSIGQAARLWRRYSILRRPPVPASRTRGLPQLRPVRIARTGTFHGEGPCSG